MRKFLISTLLFLTLPCAPRVFAQNDSQAPAASKAAEPAVHFYRLDLVVRELGEDGKPVNSRSYSCTVSTARGESDSVRIGSKVPVATGSPSSVVAGPIVSVQFTYRDVGVNFDASGVREIGNKLAMKFDAEINSLGSSMRLGGANGIEEPVTRENRWQAQVLIPIGKSTVVFTSDDLDSKGSMEVLVTATPLQ